jgi:hypothetical protein
MLHAGVTVAVMFNVKQSTLEGRPRALYRAKVAAAFWASWTVSQPSSSSYSVYALGAAACKQQQNELGKAEVHTLSKPA